MLNELVAVGIFFKGIIIAGPNVVRFTPSLIIPFADIDEGLKRFERAIARFVEIQKDEQAA